MLRPSILKPIYLNSIDSFDIEFFTHSRGAPFICYCIDCVDACHHNEIVAYQNMMVWARAFSVQCAQAETAQTANLFVILKFLRRLFRSILKKYKKKDDLNL